MKLFVNLTSPFARIVRMTLIEKGIEADTTVVDAWADSPDFLDANPAGRVPALVTDDGARLSEAPLIVHYLETLHPEPALLPPGAAGGAALSRAGLGINVFEAAVAVIIGRKSTPEFDGNIVGRKRFRTMRDGIAALDAALPADTSRPFDLGDVAAVTALDYLIFRFPDTDWRAMAPKVARLRDANADRPSVRDTAPKG